VAGPIYQRLLDYFQGVADALAGAKKSSAIFPNSVDAGSSREDLLVTFLREHLPKRCEVIRGGFVFDDKGNESKQLDVIVTNDLTLQFRPFQGAPDEGKSFNFVEGCYAAISVKSNLDKASLFDSIENLASIPATPPLTVNPMLKADEVLDEIPLRILFAFESVSPKTIWEHLHAYYAEHDIPSNRRLNMIIANNAFNIIKVKASGATTHDGESLAPETYYPQGWKLKGVGGLSLLELITEIQVASNVGSHVLMNFNRYLDLLPLQDSVADI
jgi:hypothetical protein